jgi:hypothetical protein
LPAKKIRSGHEYLRRECAKVNWQRITQQLSQFSQSLFPAAVAKKLPRAFLVVVKKNSSLYSSIPRTTIFGCNIGTFLPALARHFLWLAKRVPPVNQQFLCEPYRGQSEHCVNEECHQGMAVL